MYQCRSDEKLECCVVILSGLIIRQAEEFVNRFENTYTLIEQRVGEASNVTSSSGGVVRILKCYPGDWQVRLVFGIIDLNLDWCRSCQAVYWSICDVLVCAVVVVLMAKFPHNILERKYHPYES